VDAKRHNAPLRGQLSLFFFLALALLLKLAGFPCDLRLHQ
jgi:hypothetical protein